MPRQCLHRYVDGRKCKNQAVRGSQWCKKHSYKKEYKVTGGRGNYTLKASRYVQNSRTGLYNLKKWRVVRRKIKTKKDVESWKYLDKCGGRPL